MSRPSSSGHFLVEIRKSLGVTQKQYAKLIGTSESSIKSIEIGRLAISKKMGARINAFAKCPIYWHECKNCAGIGGYFSKIPLDK